MTSGGLRLALSMFTVAPVPRRWHAAGTGAAGAAVRWLPLVGFASGALAGLADAGATSRHVGAGLLGAALAVAGLAWLARGLHLDGLADTADGLGSRAPRERALAIMAQSDIGPFGVAAIVTVLVVDVAALATVADGSTWRGPAALAVAAGTGRTAVLLAAVRGMPSARPGGFGALVAGTVPPVTAVGLAALVLAADGGIAWWAGASLVGWVAAAAGALLLSVLLAVRWRRRLGGVTGDVFGALVEVTTAATLVGLALV